MTWLRNRGGGEKEMGVYDYHKEGEPSSGRITLYEKMPEMTEGNPYKAYIDVIARFSEGQMLPLSLTWENGRSYEIDKIKRIQRMASRKAGGCGICYTCIIRNQEVQLFYEENGLWFVTRKNPVQETC